MRTWKQRKTFKIFLEQILEPGSDGAELIGGMNFHSTHPIILLPISSCMPKKQILSLKKKRCTFHRGQKSYIGKDSQPGFIS